MTRRPISDVGTAPVRVRSAIGRGLGGGLSWRVLAGACAALLMTGLLGAAMSLQPASAAAPASVSQAAPVPMSSGLAAVDLAARGVKQGCPGPDALCDLGGDVADCVGSPIDCGQDAAGEVQDGVENGLGGLADNLPGLPSVPGLGGCGILDAVCDGVSGGGLPGIPGIPDIPGLPDIGDLFGGGIPGLGDIPNPMAELGDIIAKAAADAWTAAMLAIWNSGLFVLRIVLTFSELFLTPDLRADGPGQDVYAYTLWFALALVMILTVIQLGAAAFKREGKGLGRALIGAGQFVVICATWFGYCVTIVAACGAITRALMKALLKVNTWPDWEPLGGLGTEDIADATVATVLAFLGIFLWLAAIGHILVYLARAASLLVLTATGPLSAAGLVSDFTRAWFWKSLRWFHAAAFTPVLMVMVLGIGVQMSNGVAAHLADDTQKSIGTALPAVMLILVSVVAPLALFKLLAFVDPGTPSGASFRQGMAIQGGIQGLLSGGGAGGAGGGSSAASSSDSSGRSAGEQNAEGSTGDRFSKSAQGVLGSLGPAGQAMAAGMGLINSAGAKATSLMSDETNQAGVGQNTYGPDFSGTRGGSNSQSNGQSSQGGQGDNNQPGGQGDGQSGGPGEGQGGGQGDDAPTTPIPPTPSVTPANLPAGGQSSQGGSGGSGGSGGQGGGQGAPKPPGGGPGGGAGGGAGGGPGGAAGGAGGATAVPPVA